MDRLQILFAKAEAYADKMKALEMARDAAEDKSFTDEQREEYRSLVAKLEAVNDEIDLEEKAQGVKERTAQPQAAVVSLEAHNAADQAPYTFGEFLQDIVKATRAQFREQSPRLDMHQKRNLAIVRKEFHASTGLNEAVPSEGGFLVGTDFAPGLIERVYNNSIVAAGCSRVGIGANSNGIKINGVDETSRATGSRSGGVVGYWVAEGGTITASKPKFRQVELNLKKVAALYYATDEEIQDAAALGAFAERAVVAELDFMLQDAIINGNGAGKPLGFLQAPGLVTITKETGQDADTIVFSNISKMWAAAWGPGRLNSMWLINQEIEPQLDLLAIPVGTGGVPAYMPPGGIADSPYGRLKGRPVVPVEQAAALGDAGDISLVDLSQYQLIDKGGVQMASSMHVQFLTDELVFRFLYRVDGQPLWHSALTPYKGAQTLSAFVTLGARA